MFLRAGHFAPVRYRRNLMNTTATLHVVTASAVPEDKRLDFRYMAPTTPERLRITVAGNEFDGELSADAAGIVATLFALGQLAATEADDIRDQFVHLFHWLREYAAEHAEARLIFRAID